MGDRVWHDLNANGFQDSGEPGISGVTVRLLNSSGSEIAALVTGAGGIYTFTGVSPANYIIAVTLPAGYTFSPQNQGGDDAGDSDVSPLTGQTVIFAAPEGTTNSTIDAGMYRPASIGDRAWLDANANGIQDAGESGLSGVDVALTGGNQTLFATTDNSGSYLFTGLPPGTYSVVFIALPGYIFSPRAAGGDNTLDSNAYSSGDTDPFALASGQSQMTIDAGLYPGASVGDRLWHDLNANGIQDAGEPGASPSGNPSEVTISLYTGGGSLVGTTNPAADGSYGFSGLMPGSYYLEVSIFPPLLEFSFSPQDVGGNDAADSDANFSGRTANFTLASGENDTTRDMGFFFYGGISITNPWLDLNGDGVQNAGDNPLPNGTSTMTLYRASDNGVEWSGSSGLGFWYRPDTYYVTYTLPGGYAFSPQGIDSDVDATGRTANFTITSGEQRVGVRRDVPAGQHRGSGVGRPQCQRYSGRGRTGHRRRSGRCRRRRYADYGRLNDDTCQRRLQFYRAAPRQLLREFLLSCRLCVQPIQRGR